jgi:hypothetical protein
VLQALVAEVYGPDAATRQRVAEATRAIFDRTPGVVDVDWYVESPQPKQLLVVDKEKAALHGITADAVARTLRVAVAGESVGRLHVPRDQEDVDIVLDVPRWQRSEIADLLSIRLPDASGRAMVPLSELVRVESTLQDRSIYHKNLLPVVYVTGDVAAGAESPAYAIFQMNKAIAALPEAVAIYNATQPPSARGHQVGWRVGHHARAVPRSGRRVRRGAAAHLRLARRLLSLVLDAARRDGRDPVLSHRHPARARGALGGLSSGSDGATYNVSSDSNSSRVQRCYTVFTRGAPHTVSKGFPACLPESTGGG